MPRLRLLPVALGTSLLVAAAAVAAGSSFSGAWTGPGTIIKGIPVCSRPAAGQVGCQSSGDRALSTFRLKFDSSGAGYYAVGPTGASHDSPSAKASCTMRLALDRTSGGWTYYQARTRGKSVGAVGGLTVPCQTTSPKEIALVARVRKAGTKLRIEFGTTEPRSFEEYTYLTRA